MSPVLRNVDVVEHAAGGSVSLSGTGPVSSRGGWRTAKRVKGLAGVVGCVVAGFLGGCFAAPAEGGDENRVATAGEAITGVTYGGRASVLRADVLGIAANVVDTGALPSSGGTLGSSLLTAGVPGLFTAGVAEAHVSGVNDETTAETHAANVHLGVGAINLTLNAAVISSTATVDCRNGVPVPSASTVITGLSIDGLPVVVTGVPNQTIDLLVGQIVINERSSSVSGSTGLVHSAPIHVAVAGLVDVYIAVADAAVTCPAAPPPNGCDDGIKDGSETDVDCGGPVCAPCAPGLACVEDADCANDDCPRGICYQTTCDDGIKDDGESDVDCGGPSCAYCAVGQSCNTGSDCQTNLCSGGKCAD
jgi:hypothetical protein